MCQPNFSMAFWVHRACVVWIVVTVSVRGDSPNHEPITIHIPIHWGFSDSFSLCNGLVFEQVYPKPLNPSPIFRGIPNFSCRFHEMFPYVRIPIGGKVFMANTSAGPPHSGRPKRPSARCVAWNRPPSPHKPFPQAARHVGSTFHRGRARQKPGDLGKRGKVRL